MTAKPHRAMILRVDDDKRGPLRYRSTQHQFMVRLAEVGVDHARLDGTCLIRPWERSTQINMPSAFIVETSFVPKLNEVLWKLYEEHRKIGPWDGWEAEPWTWEPLEVRDHILYVSQYTYGKVCKTRVRKCRRSGWVTLYEKAVVKDASLPRDVITSYSSTGGITNSPLTFSVKYSSPMRFHAVAASHEVSAKAEVEAWGFPEMPVKRRG